ncbi:Crp/Fnr family transcriptional regulator [Roseivirga echinicomitans]
MTNPLCASCPNDNKLFCGLSNLEKGKISAHKQFKFFKKGEVIFTRGKKAQGLFCIFQGKVKLSKTGDEGRDVIIRLVNKGEVLGYRALLSDDYYQSTATAMEDSQICKVSRAVFLDVLKHSPQLSHNMIRQLTSDLKESENNIISQSQASVKQRIARSLLLLKAKFGVEEDGQTLAVNITRREIGEIAGTTTESAIRMLSDLDKEGVIQLDGKHIMIRNNEFLFAVTNLHE